MSSEVKGLDFERLTRANYQTWIEKVKDYVLALDDENAVTMWEDYVWMRPADAGADVKDPVDEKDWQEANNAQARKARRVHNQAFAYIRRHLSDEIFKTQDNLVPFSVDVLLTSSKNAGRGWFSQTFLAQAQKIEPKNKQIKQALQFAEVRMTQEMRKRMQG